MDVYSFNGIRLTKTVLGLSGLGELQVGTARVFMKFQPDREIDIDDLNSQLPQEAIASNLRPVRVTTRGKEARVQARAEIDIATMDDGTLLLEGSIHTFALQ